VIVESNSNPSLPCQTYCPSQKKLFADMWSAYGEDENHQYLSEIESWLSIPVRV
jgi:hypothetical protein